MTTTWLLVKEEMERERNMVRATYLHSETTLTYSNHILCPRTAAHFEQEIMKVFMWNAWVRRGPLGERSSLGKGGWIFLRQACKALIVRNGSNNSSTVVLLRSYPVACCVVLNRTTELTYLSCRRALMSTYTVLGSGPEVPCNQSQDRVTMLSPRTHAHTHANTHMIVLLKLAFKDTLLNG